MWIFTVNGFFTFVVDRKDPTQVWLRARLREDIERNFPGVEVQEHPGADYLFRAKIPRTQLAQRMSELVMEADVTSHFKDEMIRRAAKPKFGSRSSMMYAVWNAGAALQPHAPYSKTPRPEPKPFTGGKTVTYGGGSWAPNRSHQPSGGLGSGATSGRYGSEFDWDARDWGGKSTADPALGAAQSAGDGDLPMPDTMTDDEFEIFWNGLTPAERDSYLDETEDAQRALETADVAAPVITDVLPDPRNRPGSRRQRRKEKKGRRNRHNQEHPSRMGMGDRQHTMTDAQYAVYAQERRDGKHGKRQQDRQAFLDQRDGGKH